MRQRSALNRALSRAGRRPLRQALPVSRLRLRTHGILLGTSGRVRLLYLTASHASTAMRIDSRLTLRLLLTEARAARTASLHATLVCMMAARNFLARLGHHLGHGIVARSVHRAQAARSLSAGEGILHLWRWPDRGRSAFVRESQGHDVLRTLTLSQILTSTQRFFRELNRSYKPSFDASTVAQRMVTTRLRTSQPLDDLPADIATGRPGSTAPSHRATTLPLMHLRDRHTPSLRGISTTRRATTARPVSANAVPRAKYLTAWARDRMLAMSDTAITQAAMPSPAMPSGYASTATATLRFRRTPRAPAPVQDAKRQASQLQQQVVRQVTQELAQNTPWRGQIEQAVLAPRVLRELTDRVAGAIAGRHGLERYRRGL